MIQRLTLLFGAVLVMGAMEPPTQSIPVDPVEGAKQGRALARELLSQKPRESSTNRGTIKIRDRKGRRSLPVTFAVVVTGTNWSNVYQAASGSNRYELTVVHQEGQPNEYQLTETTALSDLRRTLRGNQTMIPFATSDFWLADLGVEFLRWPEQRIVKKELRRHTSCNVLESVNPHPEPGAYFKVISWVDIDTGGIVHADAFDSKGKEIKHFDPVGFEKVQGVYEVKEIEMYNDQTGSRTQILFDLTQ